MRAVRLSASVLALTLAGAGAAAQTTYPSPYASVPAPYPVQPSSDADQLASEIRLLAANPQDLQALVRAGELALKLDDDTAAAAFFARAERIDPRNARVKAGEGSLLVSAERPGDALRHFAEAERLGADPRSFAADRALAYDLVGEQERAQRDYRVALRAGPNDETQRRYALSLGISGKRELALTQIDPLLRKSDRGAWRARAFILAMGGDKASAEKIATSMMPAGMAQGLQPFFDILPGLRPADRAFAVHFGEVRTTPERAIDARLVPPLAALGPDPTALVAVAVVSKPAVVVDAREEKRKAREARKNRGRVAVAAVTTPPPVPLPAPPVYAGQAPAPRYVAPVPYYARPSAGSRAVIAANTAQLPPVTATAPRPAAAAPVPFVQRLPNTAAATVRSPVVVASVPTVQRTPTPVVPSPAPRATVTPATAAAAASWPAAPMSVPRAAPTVTATASTIRAAETPAALPVPKTDTVRPTITPTPVVPSAVAVQTVTVPPPATATLSAAAETAPVVTAAAPPPVSVAPVVQTLVPKPVRSEDSILAAIISDIKVPGSELQVAPIRAVETPAPIETPDPAIAERAAAARAAAEEKLAAKEAADKKAADKKLADKNALADKKAIADKKAAVDKKIADAKKLADAKAAEEKRKHDPKLLEPSRVWVQVAGGANEGDLPKQWSKLRSANAKQFAGKSGWTTPLRATNRILTGPFADSDEAQAFVNKIAKDGLSGFVFVSEAGQKITKLGSK